MRIGDLALRTGLSTRALRYYEEQGLLAPRRRPSGYREYTDADVDTVRRIRVMLAAGLSTAFIAEVLPCVAAEGGVAEPLCPELRDELLGEHDRISRRIDELDRARSMLTAIIDAPARYLAAQPAVRAS
jgi:DNA-binding transcriptional MerR regulator